MGALGFPIQIPGISVDKLFNERFSFHDTRITRSVEFAFQAKAVDELRAVFDVTPMNPGASRGQVIEEAWLPGNHSCVGGGRKAVAPLSIRCLVWMLERMKAHGIHLATDLERVEDGVVLNHRIRFDNTQKGFYRLAKLKPRSIRGSFDQLDISVLRRWRDCPDYRPPNLSRRFRSRLDSWVEGS